ncbi:MAG: molybdopterin converting factor subunit 1 [Chloroflexi bacterium]|nr:MAG: molybdopterin converting factor subunit 1 [Chloroflexota bacterium]
MTATLRVEVLLFAQLREQAGRRTLELEVPAAATVRDAWAAARTACPRLDGGEQALRVAVNQEYTSWDAPLGEGDVVAFIPPVAGGATERAAGELKARVSVRITRDRLDARDAEALVRTDADGAVCTFTGTVRDHADGRAVTKLEYEAYESMAETEMRRIAEEAVRRFGASRVAVLHRLGSLAVGEPSVVVSASAPHRATAFEACRWTIDTLKAEVPIWKKEYGEGGSLWVDEGRREH